MSDAVLISVVGGVASVVVAGVAIVPTWLNSRHTKQDVREVKAAVGTPNGNGDLARMTEALLLAFQQHAENDERRFNEITDALRDGQRD